MPTRLEIVLDGSVPGLPEHRLSVGAFGPSLFALLGAVRRIASNLVREAQGDEPKARGRHLRAAEAIDLELVSIRGDSPTTLTLDVVSHAADALAPLLFDFPELPDRAAAGLLDAIEQESRGVPTSGAVRDFLRRLPEGLTEQRYRLEPSVGEPREVVVQTMDLAEQRPAMPYLADVLGSVVGVGFEPGRTQVRLKPDDGRQLVCEATFEMVEHAWTLRGEEVAALVVRGVGGAVDRLVGLGRVEAVDGPPKPGTDRYERLVFGKWTGLLDRLAK